MNGISCTVFLYSNAMHNEQVYTGLATLHKEGIINLRVKNVVDASRSQTLSITRLQVQNIQVIIDTHDNFGLYTTGIIENAQLYFKRAFQLDGYEAEEKKYEVKVLPLGLNYALYGRQQYWINKYTLEKKLSTKVEAILRNNTTLSKLFNLNTSAGYCNENCLSALPNPSLPPRAILMTRVWEIHKNLQPWQIENRTHLNKLRSDCILALRNAFGEQFYGGLFIDEFSKKNYPNLLLPSNKMADKKNYLQLLKQYPIGISINGLFSSGWSLGEFTALSKAIVTDKPTNLIPGDYLPNRNYLSFSNPDECVRCVEKLLNNHDLRVNMMQNNYQYYQQTLNPRSMMLRVIETALSLQ